MSSTNKTAHYSLSQYVANDKPTYLSDYNGDMAKIDAAIYAAKSAADTAERTASGLAPTVTENEANIGELQTDMGLIKATQTTQGNAISSLQEFMEQVMGATITEEDVAVSLASGNNSSLGDTSLKMKKYDMCGLKLTAIYGKISITPNGSQNAGQAFKLNIPSVISRLGSGRLITNVGIAHSTTTEDGQIMFSMGIQNDTLTAMYGTTKTPLSAENGILIQCCILG